MENNAFEYTYSPQRQQEVEAIRQKYLPRQEDKMDTLRKLHAIPTRKANTAALAVGILGALILGTGMSLCMTDLGAFLGNLSMTVGIVIGLMGLVLVALAYPIHNRTLQREREKIAPEILHLTEELLK